MSHRTAAIARAAQRPRAGTTPAGVLQRKCACGGSAGPGGECEACRKKRLQRKAASQTETSGAVPSVVHDVLRSPGQPLDAATRSFFEPRFGHDFGRVRVHTDGRAAESATAVNALAYTVGSDVVFGARQYAPHTDRGRHLLAHELTHVIQQQGAPVHLQSLALDGGARDPFEREAQHFADVVGRGRSVDESISSGPVRIHRQPNLTDAAAGGCGVCFRGDVKNVGNIAHDLIQTEFELMYPDMIDMTEFPLSIEGKPFIIQKGIPDLVLPTPTGLKIGEIKPANPKGYFEGDAKIEIYKALAREMFKDRKPPITIEPLELPPPPPMPFLEPAAIKCPQMLYTNPSVRGVYGYLCWPPFSQLVRTCKCVEQPEKVREPADRKERKRERKRERERMPETAGAPVPIYAAIALALAALGFAVKKLAPKILGKAAGGWAYAVASLAAVAFLLGTRRAEAKLNVDAEEPLLQLFKSLEQQGTPVPPELREMIESNPELKAKLEQAQRPGADASTMQAELNDNILQILQEHRTEFTSEELEVLLGATTALGPSGLPKQPLTAATLRKMLDERRGAPGSSNVWERAKEADTKPKVNVWEKAKGTGDTTTAQLKAKYPQLSEATRARLAAANENVRMLFDAFAAGVRGPGIDDAVVAQFLAIVPANLTAAQSAAIRARLAPATDRSIEQVLASLRQAIAELKPAPEGVASAGEALSPGRKGPESTKTTGPGGPGKQEQGPKIVPEIFSDQRYAAISRGRMVMFPVPSNPNKPENVTILGVLQDGLRWAASATAQLVSMTKDGTKLTITILSVDQIIDARGGSQDATRLIGTGIWNKDLQ